MLGQDIITLFQSIGPIGLVLAFCMISYLDGFAIPTLPEAWLILIAISNPNVPLLLWGAVLVLAGVASAVSAQASLFLVVRKFGIPSRIKKIMNRYTKVLIVSNEKLAFVNWLAPVLPFTGAFIAVSDWKPNLAFAYSILGGFVKMTILVGVALAFPLFFDPGTVANASIVLVLVVLGVSLAITYIRHRKFDQRIMSAEPPESGEEPK